MTEKNTIKGKIRGWDGHFHPYETTGTIINRLTNNRVIVLEKNRAIIVYDVKEE